MGLSKKNLNKLNTFNKESNFVNNNNSGKSLQESNNASKVDEPSKIFYSIIDNADNINETSRENQLLKKSEDCFHNINFRKSNHSNNLSIEDDLYDQFNYLLDE